MWEIFGIYIYIYIYIPVNPLPGVETNGSFFDLGMVPSCAAGCRLMATWLHSGYRIPDYLVTGLSFDSSLISRNPIRSVPVVRWPDT